MRVGARRERPALAREVGARGAARNVRRAAGVGVRLLRGDHALRRVRHDRRCGHADARGAVPGRGRRASPTRASSSTTRTSRSCSRSTAGRGPTIRSSARRELAGLKVLLMLISNWDNKDQRDVARGSNTAIYVTRVSRWKREAQYLIVDWGGSMGRWGGTVVTRGRWDAAGFAAQTPQFVTGVANGFVQFGYTGQRTADARADIRVEDVRVAVPLPRPHHRRSAPRRPHGQRRDRRRDRVVRRVAARADRAAAPRRGVRSASQASNRGQVCRARSGRRAGSVHRLEPRHLDSTAAVRPDPDCLRLLDLTPGLGARGRRGGPGIFGPGVARIAAAQFLADFLIRRVPEAAQVARRLHRRGRWARAARRRRAAGAGRAAGTPPGRTAPAASRPRRRVPSSW